jgi:hypothetical protein
MTAGRQSHSGQQAQHSGANELQHDNSFITFGRVEFIFTVIGCSLAGVVLRVLICLLILIVTR